MRGRKTNMEDVDIKIEWVDPSTPEGKRSWDNGVRILARMIARAYLKDQAEKNKAEAAAKSQDKESPTLYPEKPCSREVSPSDVDAKSLPEKRLGLTVHEAATILGLKDTSVYRAVKIGQIPSVKFGKRIVIPKESLIEILSRARTRTASKGLSKS